MGMSRNIRAGAILAAALTSISAAIATGQTLPVAGNPQEAVATEAAQRDGIRGVREQDAAAARVSSQLNANAPQAAGQAVDQTVGGTDALLRAGILIDGRNPNRMIIQQVLPNSPAALAGLRSGDVITRVNGNPVTSISALAQALATGRGNGLGLQVDRNGQSRQLNLGFNDSAVRTAMANRALPSNPAGQNASLNQAGAAGAQAGTSSAATGTTGATTAGTAGVTGSGLTATTPSSSLPGAVSGTAGFGATTTGSQTNSVQGSTSGATGTASATTINGGQALNTTTGTPPVPAGTISSPSAVTTPTSPSLLVQPDKPGGALSALPESVRQAEPSLFPSPGAASNATGGTATGSSTGTIGTTTTSSSGTVSPSVGGGFSAPSSGATISGNTIGAPTTSSSGTVTPGIGGGATAGAVGGAGATTPGSGSGGSAKAGITGGAGVGAPNAAGTAGAAGGAAGAGGGAAAGGT